MLGAFTAGKCRLNTAPRPFRFGVNLAAPLPGRSLADSARLVEDCGYAVLSCPDHLDHPDSPLEPMVLLATAAAATSALELQPLVMANDFRHPVLLAKQAATLDLLSEGRFSLGIGAGWYGPEYQSAGIDFHRPGVRIARLREALAVIRGLHGAEPFDFSGDYYRIEALQGLPRPRRNPLPLLIGGSGPRMLAFAAACADTVALNLGLPIGMPRPRGATPYATITDMKLQWIRQAAAARATEVEIQSTIFAGAVTDGDPDSAITPLAQLLQVPAASLRGCPHVLAGSAEDCIEQLLGWRERWGISYVTVPAVSAESFAPVVAALRGR
ncbi:MAG: luciferase [Halioglobus sp.]|nr:luciferase [Halioglobus sp.]